MISDAERRRLDENTHVGRIAQRSSSTLMSEVNEVTATTCSARTPHTSGMAGQNPAAPPRGGVRVVGVR